MSASFDYYRTFYYVAKYKNFTRAATMLLSSQPSVTRSIQNLESELGCRLFIRSRHGVCLLLDRLALFQKEHPDVKIRISNGTTAHMLSDLKEGRTDVAVVPTPLQIEKPYSTVRLRPVRSILVGGPRFSALMDKPISLQELIQYPLAGLTEATMSHQFYENFFAAHGLPLNYDIELASADLLLPVVSHNLGLAFMPEDLAAQALSEKRIVSIPLTEEIPNRYICLVRDPSRPLGAAARCLIDMLLADRIG